MRYEAQWSVVHSTRAIFDAVQCSRPECAQGKDYIIIIRVNISFDPSRDYA